MPKPAIYKLKAAAMMLLAIGAGWLGHATLYDQYLERLQYAHLKAPRFKHTLENRDGILTIGAGPEDIMYGGGIYDGRFNLNPLTNGNGIDRAFMIASLHRCTASRNGCSRLARVPDRGPAWLPNTRR